MEGPSLVMPSESDKALGEERSMHKTGLFVAGAFFLALALGIWSMAQEWERAMERKELSIEAIFMDNGKPMPIVGRIVLP